MNTLNLDCLKKEHIGKVYGSLEILDVFRSDSNVVTFKCKCACGNIKEVPYRQVIRGCVKSCGCRKFTAKRLNIDDLKIEYVGNQINWLSIIDVFRDSVSGTVKFKCKCRCGNIKDFSKKALLGKHAPISCGCYSTSKEKSEAQRQYYADHPEAVVRMSEKRKQWAKENPEKCKAVGKHNSELYDKDPSRRAAVGKRILQWRKDNPDKARELAAAHSKWFYENQDLVKEASDKRVKYLKDHPEIEISRRDSISKWAKENPAKIADIANQNKTIALKKRACTDYSALLSIIEPSYIDRLKSGSIKAGDLIETKCPCCGNYAQHKVSNVFVLSRADLKGSSAAPLCKECHIKLTSSLTSKYEDEIANIVSTFYSGTCIRNDRSILNGKELDLYYSEKKIAIEFNGAYWHSTEIKPDGYHYKKYATCRQHGILLVSIFENIWLSRKNEIIDYLHDLFDSRDNALSFTKEGYMDNNFPSPNTKTDNSHIDDITFYESLTIQTCGYSIILY